MILLLELYHGFPILWNVLSSDYKKRNIQIIFLRKFQEGLSTTIPSITVEDINEKLHKLRTQYQKERNKIKSSSRNGLEMEYVYKPMLWFYEKMSFLDENEIKPSVSTLNEENILKENVQSEISLTDLNDMNTYVSENKIPSGSDKISDVTSSIDVDVDITSPKCVLPELSSSNISSKKRKLYDEFSTFIKNDIDMKMKSLVNPTVERDMFSVFAKMIMEELKCLSPRQQIYTKKLMYDALHIGILKKFEDDEKHFRENVESVVKDDKTQETTLTDWDENIIYVISMILGKGLRSKAFDLIQLLLREIHNNFKTYNYTFENRYEYSHTGIFTRDICYEIMCKRI